MSVTRNEESESPPLGGSIAKLEDPGLLGTEGDVSQCAQSQEYSFARNPNIA